MTQQLVAAFVLALVLVLALAVGSWVRRNRQPLPATQHVPTDAWWRSGIWLATFLLGFAVSLIVLFLAVSLTVKVWDGAMGSVAAAKPAVSQPADAGAVSDKAGDATVNAMTAVGMVIAVVTLVLGVGTSWFGTQQRELDAKLRAADQQLARSARQQELDAARGHVAICGMAAKRAALQWMHTEGTTPQLLALRFLEVSIDLDLLAVEDRASRRKAFLSLASLFDPDFWSDDLALIRHYTEECHRYLRAAHAHRAGSMRLSEEADFEKAGIACRIFDAAEVERVRKHP